MIDSELIRKPAVAGQFYPGNKKALEEAVASLMKSCSGSKAESEDIKGLILPHAGYLYSGRVAAATVKSCSLQETMIILGPNHTGLGEAFSVMTRGSWQLPTGRIPIHAPLAEKMVETSDYLRADHLAHDSEHSIEVLLPFLQFIRREFTIVPIVVSFGASAEVYRQVAMDIVKAIKELKMQDSVSIVASSDMTHYEPQDSAEEKDRYAIEPILRLDSDMLLKRVREKNISMCGVAPVAVMLNAMKQLGATKATLVKYQTSADTTGDASSVVGYAGLRIA